MDSIVCKQAWPPGAGRGRTGTSHRHDLLNGAQLNTARKTKRRNVRKDLLRLSPTKRGTAVENTNGGEELN